MGSLAHRRMAMACRNGRTIRWTMEQCPEVMTRAEETNPPMADACVCIALHCTHSPCTLRARPHNGKEQRAAGDDGAVGVWLDCTVVRAIEGPCSAGPTTPLLYSTRIMSRCMLPVQYCHHRRKDCNNKETMPRCCPIHPSIGRSIHPSILIIRSRREERDRGALLFVLLPWRKQGRFQKASSSRDQQEPGAGHASHCRVDGRGPEEKKRR
jgi:hypothetical protein